MVVMTIPMVVVSIVYRVVTIPKVVVVTIPTVVVSMDMDRVVTIPMAVVTIPGHGHGSDDYSYGSGIYL